MKFVGDGAMCSDASLPDDRMLQVHDDYKQNTSMTCTALDGSLDKTDSLKLSSHYGVEHKRFKSGDITA